jgi:tetratricopeptide (TPR) repeat protein
LEVLTYEQSLDRDPAAEFYGRLASIYERRADQLEQSAVAASATPAERLHRDEQVRELRTHAGDAYIAYSRGLTLADDRGHSEALWKGVDQYDRAGAVPKAISALELYVAERPDDGQTPDALLRLGQTYQAAGQFDKAITAFQRNQFRYPQSLAASKSGVPLAQAYIAKGPEHYQKAEKVLLDTIESPLIGPDAEEFHQALFELSQLFYRTGRFEEAIARLEEMAERYPKDDRLGQLLFLMGDSYRKSATLLVKLASASSSDAVSAGAADQAEAAAAKRERLSKAGKLFDRVVDLYHAAPPRRDLDKLYQKLSHFYRADCLYDLGQYDEAIKLYDAAALRYQDDPSALAAYVQIVNAYVAMGKTEEARAANEYWEHWLKWTNDVGMWSKGAALPPTRLPGKATAGAQ